MYLKWFHVREFQSVGDSGRIDVDGITCLVGKNEAGKSALLKALYRLNPVVASDGKFSINNDYPRLKVEDYLHEVGCHHRAIVCESKALGRLHPRVQTQDLMLRNYPENHADEKSGN